MREPRAGSACPRPPAGAGCGAPPRRLRPVPGLERRARPGPWFLVAAGWLLTLALPACSPHAAVPSPDDPPGPLDDAVYRAVLGQPPLASTGRRADARRQRVVEPRTIVPTMLVNGGWSPPEQLLARIAAGETDPPAELLEFLPELDAETLRRFFARNASTVQLEPRFAVDPPVILLDEARVKEQQVETSSDFWEAFDTCYPGNAELIGFSQVGFGPDGKQALVHAGRSTDALSGTGYLLLLQRADDSTAWTVVNYTIIEYDCVPSPPVTTPAAEPAGR